MSTRRSPLIPVLLAAVLLVGAANLGAYAANGGPLLLGKGNTASKTTKLKTTGNGAALKLTSKAGVAPFKVSNSTKIAKLNADQVDGLDSTQLRNAETVDGLEGDALKTKSFVYELTATAVTQNFVQFALPNLPAGKYAVNFSISAAVTGGPGAFFGCFVVTGTPATDVPIASLGVFSGAWFVTGGGYVDGSATAPRLSCQRSGGTDMTIPAAAALPNSVVLTRIDDATAGASTGTGATAPRSFARP